MEKRRVLIADDARINRETLKVIYDRKYEIIEAEDGEKTISLIQTYGEEIDLILLDLNMPKKTGFDVLDYMGEQDLLSQIPVIVITSSTAVDDEIRAFNSGASEIVRKPFLPELVLRRSENLINLYDTKKSLSRQLMLSRAELSGIQHKDPLTGLLNMQAFFETARGILEQADEETAKTYSFIYTNITNFKYYNMMNGAAEGDQILRVLAANITGTVENILCARFGQDHFVVMTTNPGDKIREKVKEIADDFSLIFGQYGMQFKAGIYQVRKKDLQPNAGCEYAKLACDSIRDTMDNACEYTLELHRKMEIAAYVIQHIDEAIENHHIQVYYQPVIRTMSGKTCGMEALARWIDPVKGFLSPADFIGTLERNRQIAKLDLYVLRETCLRMKELKAAGAPVLPVSINLSRTDFLECDIFKEVNRICEEYDIPHDVINIEITETALMGDNQYLKEQLECFRENGYQVWMDDFGSGYSSLNLLKDYQFDEIKLDMKFMSSFTEKSKEIVKAIISMAKRVGIQTLAEGVETEEQYEFLKEIGCEKVQGYYFSKPLPVSEMKSNRLMAVEQIERREWKHYYDSISAANLITEKTLAIVESEGQEFRFLYMNEAFEEVLHGLGAMDLETACVNMNSLSSPTNRLYCDLRDRCRLGEDVQELVYSLRDHYIRLSVRRIAEYKGSAAFEAEIIDLSGAESELANNHLDRAGRRLFGMFDVIFQGDMKTGKAEMLRQGDLGLRVDPKELAAAKTVEDFAKIAASQLHPEDREEFFRFTDLSTLKERVEKSGRIYLTGYFRSVQANGAYIWKAHRILYKEDSHTAIYTAYYVPVDDEKVLRKITPVYLRLQESSAAEQQKKIMEGILESTTQNLFWKDADRRFIGANRGFLETYGFRDVTEILGKTDEDMGWHVSDGPFMSDEESVLANGTVVLHQPGVCMIRGIARNIVATKEPMYHNGKIVGLFGSFIDADALKKNEENGRKLGISDQVTGLMSPQGLINAMTGYVEEWQSHQQNFASISVGIPEYTRAVADFGEDRARAMLREVAQIISGTVGIKGTCARLHSGNFIILMRYREKENVQALAEQIREGLKKAHTLAGFSTTIYPRVEISYSDERDNIHAVLGFIADCALSDIVEEES